MIKSVHLAAPCQGEEAVTDRVCKEVSFQHRPPSPPHPLLCLSAPSQSDMQFIPGVLCKALLTDAEVQIPPRQLLSSGYQRSKTGGRAGRQAGGAADRKMENNADDCERARGRAAI